MFTLFQFDKQRIRKYLASIFTVIAFAVSFGLVEAMVAIYLRHILATTSHDIFTNVMSLSTRASLFSLGFVVFLRPEVLSSWDTLHLEIFREIATVVMLITLAYLAGRNIREKLAYYLLGFGVWDIFYYVWLYLFIGWPKSIYDIDVLFLIPVPWVAPVWVPTLISACMILTSFYLLGAKQVARKKQH